MAEHACPDPRAFLLEGGPIGATLIHGFPGSTTDVRLLATFLQARGLTVSAPLLPGHGTEPADLNRVRWQDWVDCAEEALAQLADRCESVFICGLSLGSLVSACLGARHRKVAGIVLYSPAIAVRNRLIYLSPLLKHLVPFWPPGQQVGIDSGPSGQLYTYSVRPTRGTHEVYRLMRVARHRLPDIAAPAIIFHSTKDQDIAPHSAQTTYDRIGSADKKLVTLHDSAHNILVDTEWRVVARRTYEFIESHS
jgi:carboxylesterase